MFTPLAGGRVLCYVCGDVYVFMYGMYVCLYSGWDMFIGCRTSTLSMSGIDCTLSIHMDDGSHWVEGTANDHWQTNPCWLCLCDMLALMGVIIIMHARSTHLFGSSLVLTYNLSLLRSFLCLFVINSSRYHASVRYVYTAMLQ